MSHAAPALAALVWLSVLLHANADAWQTPLNASSLPVSQLNVNADAWRGWMFADMVRGMEVWVMPVSGSLSSTNADNFAANITVDAQGWPTALPSSMMIQLQMGYTTADSAYDTEVNKTGSTYLRGVFVLTWRGNGTVSVVSSRNNGKGMRTLLNTAGRIVVCMDSAFRYPIVWIKNSDPNNPVRDVHLWAPRFDGAGLELNASSPLGAGNVTASLEPNASSADAPLFHPVYLAHLAQVPAAGVLRFLAWQRINGIDSTNLTAAMLPSLLTGMNTLVVIDQYYSRHPVAAFPHRFGYSYELILELCNAAQRDCWMQVPHTSDASVWRALARTAAARLGPPLRLWVEYSNEIWNAAGPYLPQRNQAAALAAQHFNVSASSLSSSQIGWGAGTLQGLFLQTVEQEWRAANQSDERLVNVVAGFTLDTTFNTHEVLAVRALDPNLAEVIAVNNYFGDSIQGEIFGLHAWAVTPDVYPDSLFEACARVLRRSLYGLADGWRANAVMATSLGVPLVGYEGGQTILPTGYGDWNNPASADFMRFIYAFQRSAQMGQVYREHYALLSASGWRMPAQWLDITVSSFYGCWGAKELVLQSSGNSTKWDAFVWWGEVQTGVLAPGDTAGNSVLVGVAGNASSLRLVGEEGNSLSALCFAAAGGGGSVTVSLLAGQVPSGAYLVDQGSGRGCLAGVPSAGTAGLYRFFVRARDASGQVADDLVELTVDPAGLSTNAVAIWRGDAVPFSYSANGSPNGRFDGARSQEWRNNNSLVCEPVVLANASAPVFASEFVGTQRLAANASSTFFGGWCLRAVNGSQREPLLVPSLTSFTGLRAGGFYANVGDTRGPSVLEVLLVQERHQFAAVAQHPDALFSFGANASVATLQVDLSSLVGDGSNEVRFVVQNGAQWLLSEAAWTSAQLGDGVFMLRNFSGSNDAGRRWAVFTPPEGCTCAMPNALQLSFAAAAFDDVRAVGLFYRGSRWRWGYTFGFTRFFALGRAWWTPPQTQRVPLPNPAVATTAAAALRTDTTAFAVDAVFPPHFAGATAAVLVRGLNVSEVAVAPPPAEAARFVGRAFELSLEGPAAPNFTAGPVWVSMDLGENCAPASQLHLLRADTALWADAASFCATNFPAARPFISGACRGSFPICHFTPFALFAPPTPNCSAHTAPRMDVAASGVDRGVLRLALLAPLSLLSVSATFVGGVADCASVATNTSYWSLSAASADQANCSMRLAAALPLDWALQHCGFTRTESANFTAFQTVLYVTTRRDAGSIRGMAVVDERSSALVLAVRFATAAVVTTPANVSVFGSVLQYGVVEAAVVTNVAALSLRVTLAVSVQWPYQLEAATVAPVSGFVAGSPEPLWPEPLRAVRPSCNMNGAVGAGQDCVQRWGLQLNRTAPCSGSQRDLNHDGWQVDFAVRCHAAFTGACSAPNPGTAFVTFDTASDDMCPRLTEAEAASVSLQVLQSAWSGPQSQFVFGTTAYFEATVISLVALERVHIERISIPSGGAAGLDQFAYLDAYPSSSGRPNDYFVDAPATAVFRNNLDAAAGFVVVHDVATADPRVRRARFALVWNAATSAASGMDAALDTRVHVDLRVRFADQAAKSASAHGQLSARADSRSSSTERLRLSGVDASSAVSGAVSVRVLRSAGGGDDEADSRGGSRGNASVVITAGAAAAAAAVAAIAVVAVAVVRRSARRAALTRKESAAVASANADTLWLHGLTPASGTSQPAAT